MITLHEVPDPGFTESELSDALRSVKRRVHRRRGGAVLPVLIAVTVGAGVYLTADQPVTGDRVAVGLPGTETAAGTIDTASEPGVDADAVAAPDADSADVALDPAAAPDAAGDNSGDQAGADAGVVGSLDAANAGSSADVSSPAGTPSTAISPGSEISGSTNPNRPNPPAINFDTSNVITRESDALASASTPPMPDADNGSAADATAGIGRFGGSDDEVGESSSVGGLEGPHTASPGSSTTSNPSAGSDDSGDGANIELPAISFEDTGEPPVELSATTSAEVAAGVVPATSDQSPAPSALPVVAKWAPEIEGRTVSITLTVIGPDGQPFPCGVFADFGSGGVQTIPCTADCQVPDALQLASQVNFRHSYTEPGDASITLGSADPACVAFAGVQFALPIS